MDKRTIIDLDNKEDVNSYITRLIVYTNGQLEDWYNGLSPEKIHFHWIKANERDYLIYRNNLKISQLYKKLEVEIKEPYKLPFDNNYTGWGSRYIRNDNEIIISDVTFDSNVESVIAKTISSTQTRVVLNYKGGSIIV